ncbi:uncharacterized protein PV07_02026 [Cladophialophora immunda]|uniref:Zn(2)-C6 fungal-type domain-containing protein n=1 Tax=Cladophialophora immunda TaxID=569365 RepID=A0A0D2DHT7_9EURO|nr:uncharacterized protein PV07_02026 [Cladophialophora immunda]KIW35324.1 hypothetical protein PV07_02026 [Cladophialophora immunda]
MGVRKGCYNCNKRRIICDETEPHCAKCTKKGLDCSGIGIRYRFNDGIASRGKLRGLSIPVGQSSSSRSNAAKPLSVGGNRSAAITNLQAKPPVANTVTRLSFSYSLDSFESNEETPEYASNIYPCLQPISGQSRFLLNHFSENIARGMVILDGQYNGYRNVIIPLAVTEPLVESAVSSVAASHLWRGNEKLRTAADRDRVRVIQSLKKASLNPRAGAVFSVSNWAILLVLLVGELITGRDDYIYLLRLLRSIQSYGVYDASRETLQFFHTQTDILMLLAQPFLDLSSDFPAMNSEAALETQLRSICASLQHVSDSQDVYITSTVIEAVRRSYQIYLNRAFLGGKSDSMALDYLQHLVSPISPNVPGGHALVWVYFIAAAESELPEHRAFFTGRLNDIYVATGCENITAGLSILEQMWDSQTGSGWPWALRTNPSTFIM